MKGVYHDNIAEPGINRWVLFEDGTKARIFVEYSDLISLEVTDKKGNLLNPDEDDEEEE